MTKRDTKRTQKGVSIEFGVSRYPETNSRNSIFYAQQRTDARVPTYDTQPPAETSRGRLRVRDAK